MNDLPDLTQYSSQELGNHIRDLRLQIAAYQAQLEAPSTPNQRTIKLARGTFLTVGGILLATLEPLAVIVAIVGFWDWIDAIRIDVDTMNRRIKFRHAFAELTQQLAAAEFELDRRIAGGSQR